MLRVAGDAMREVGVDTGDVVLVDRALTPAHGHVVIAVVDDQFVCRRLSVLRHRFHEHGARLDAVEATAVHGLERAHCACDEQPRVGRKSHSATLGLC